jgi:farnesyl diphosphate synthase
MTTSQDQANATGTGPTFALWSKVKQQHIEDVLDHTLSKRSKHIENHANKLQEAMRYSALGGGKRIRALLCYATAELCGTNAKIADAGAAAVEMIHAYSLVHDDMPCMDDDDLRRGKPSCHKQYDDATALLVGDALQSMAFYILSNPSLTEDAALQVRLINILARASGIIGMAGGQAIDLESVGKPLKQAELEAMHHLKTGALIQAAVSLGAANGSQAQINAMAIYAKNIGLAFQVVDDILDVEADSAVLGKTAGKDALSNKPTYVTILGLEAAKAHAQKLYSEALIAIKPFGDDALRLRELAELIMQRSF